ncbi:hypothetical protein CR105_00285 [Massilia eurypsychrophila]|uniref:Uncharacterized protein n=1 Tax=Massilia eurypsychrophila TaxID=1485217 RepID=A0A2G8TKT0_9BURK|nr:hypothetical protein [Massilia eurypsychrophila]PIL46636.1 hypothetical protein CR105_00285 [Massilia eurypsychrophila]
MGMKSKTKWQRQESRPVRPFRSAVEYLAEVGLRLYADEEFKAAETIQISSIEQDRLAIAVKVPVAPLNFEELVGVPMAALSLVVTLEDRAFKDSCVAANVPFSELDSGAKILELNNELVSTMSWAGETRVHIAVVLCEPRNGEVGTAHRVGSWVARKSFSVGNPRDTASFAIDAVEPEYFEKRQLPHNTTYLVEISDPDLNQSCENLPDLVKVSLAKDVHAALAKDEESPMAKALIRAIYVDVVTTVMATGYSNLGTGTPVTSNSILDVVTAKLTKSTGISPERLRILAGETAGSMLRAVVQADIELSRALISAAQRR